MKERPRPDLSRAQTAILARYLQSYRGKGREAYIRIEPRAIANVLTALSEGEGPPDPSHDQIVSSLLVALSYHSHEELCSFSPLDIVDLLTALRPRAGDRSCADTVSSLAACLPRVRRWQSHIPNLLTALGKWADNRACAEKASWMASILFRSPDMIAALGPQELADVITALRSPGIIAALGPRELADAITVLSKRPSDPSCAENASALAQHLMDSDKKVKLSRREASDVVTALRTWPSNESCAEVASKLERFVLDRFNKMMVDLMLLPHDRRDTAKSPAE